MKDILKWIIIAVLLVAVVAGAAILYERLSKEYGGNNLIENTPQKSEEGEEVSENESEEGGQQEKPPAPDFTVLDSNGNEVRLSDYKGKPVVLNFWATWCYYCKEEMPDFNEAYKNYPNVQFLMVNATDGVKETLSAAKKYVEDNGFEFDVFYDIGLETVNAYYVTGFPQTFFIDADGNLIARRNGMLDLATLEKGIAMIIE